MPFNISDRKCVQKAIAKTQQTRTVTNSYGKLTLTCSETHKISNNAVFCDLVGNASWSIGPGLFTNDETYSAPGYDYMGVTWSGGFTTSTEAANSDCNLYGVKAPDPIPEESKPNAGRVWKFNEAWIHEYFNGSPIFAFLTNIDIKMTLHKNNMTGGGNTAEAVVKYIHTYENTTGSITITAGTDKVVSGGFTLSSVSKQWSIVCTIKGIPY